MYRALIKSLLSVSTPSLHSHSQSFEFFQSTRYLKTKKKGESLQSVFHCLVAEKQWEKSKKLWFQFVFFYFGFCFEFLIELLKKIETLLFFEIGLCFWVFGFVYICCGIGLCFWVCLYLMRCKCLCCFIKSLSVSPLCSNFSYCVEKLSRHIPLIIA